MPANSRVYNPWLIALTVTLATFMELLDTSIANVSLPHIAGGLATSYDEATWVLTSYLVSNAVVLPLSAWLSKVFGRKRYYMACVAVFTLSSVLCGCAQSLSMLLIFRVVQGIGGGGLAPVEQAILVDTFPASKRAAAFGLYSMAIVTAPALGPPIGGWITDNLSWRWVFFINLPIGLLSLVLSSVLVRDPPEFVQEVEKLRKSGKMTIDRLGITLIALGFGLLEVVLDRGEREDWMGSHFIVLLLIISVVSLLLALWWELTVDDPVVDLRLLLERNFGLANSFYFLFGFVLFGSTVLIPQMLQSLFGYSATDAGLVLGPGAAVIVVLAPIVVRLVKAVSVKVLIFLGFSLLSSSMIYMGHLDLAADYRTEALGRAITGLGLAFLFVPISQLAYSYLPANKNNKASSLTNLSRNQGGSFGIAFVTTVLSRRSQFHQHQLGQHLVEGSGRVLSRLHNTSLRLLHFGLSEHASVEGARLMLYNELNRQANYLAFLDCFNALAVVALVGLPLALAIRSFLPAGSAESH